MACWSTSTTATAAPSAAKPAQTAAPIPPVPPVTTTVLPWKRSGRATAAPYVLLTIVADTTYCDEQALTTEADGPVRIAVIGGGPGGLYFAALTKQLGPHHEITVWERNAADDTFGFGVVFSDETLGGIEHADPAIHQQMEREFARWDDVDVHYRGEVITSGGHGFAALPRKRLLEILQERCRELGVVIHFRTEAPDVDELARTYDLVIASDGLNSAVRARYADVFRADARRARLPLHVARHHARCSTRSRST